MYILGVKNNHGRNGRNGKGREMGFMLVNKKTGRAVREYFRTQQAFDVIPDGYTTEETGAYLSRVNAEIRNGSTKYNSKET